jgi:glucose/arabinose dehydrogenase
MTILPNLDILIAQRRGEIMMYKNETQKVKQVGFLNAYFKTSTPGVNAEEGVLGLAKDPNFSKNNWIYIFYSPIDTSVNRLSRFEFKNDTLDLTSEKIILQFYSQREICCHTGGSIAFGPDGLLYLSAGDNSTPFNEPGQKFVNNGYAPLNDEPGHLQYDARRSSGNSNDLRGKILRIKLKDDGSYDIPEGNLYPKGTPKTRPEIYVQGNRNPYRISVDQKNSFLYWGEVGPDAANDSLDTRGPRGYDEVNQARKAGNFGWPLFVGNNYPYRNYDYTNGTSTKSFDPAKPINESRNNTGIQELPPVSPAFIWYPYAASPDFPSVGTGGRNAMAGPVFYSDMYPKETSLPAYYNGKLFIYEWIRGWIKVVTMKENGDFDKMEPFMPGVKFNSIIDMELGPEGKIYLLEYGSGWFSKNPDAAISVIEYVSGNRAPAIASLSSNRSTGALPFTVKLSAEAKDPENDPMTYTWNLGDGTTKETTVPTLDYTYDKIGDYSVNVDIKDDKGASAKSETIQLYAGNETPEVSIALTGNKSFYFPGKKVNYSVSVADKDNPTGKTDPANYLFQQTYQGTDPRELPVVTNRER